RPLPLAATGASVDKRPVQRLGVRRVELLYDAVQRDWTLAAALQRDLPQRIRAISLLDDPLDPLAKRAEVVQVFLDTLLNLAPQNHFAMALHDSLKALSAQRLQRVNGVLPAPIGEERERHHGIPGKQDRLVLDVAGDA